MSILCLGLSIREAHLGWGFVEKVCLSHYIHKSIVC
uniref:Uncharacterized protein n=1 Tax=Anguilla anguilla TaxID=7936 RepID=A0A0E9PNP0_ANGAN